MASEDSAYKDDVAPEVGSPFRPLYDDRIHYSGQPIALVIAEESEIARFATSLVRVTYEEAAHVTDVFSHRDRDVVLEPGSNMLCPAAGTRCSGSGLCRGPGASPGPSITSADRASQSDGAIRFHCDL